MKAIKETNRQSSNRYQPVRAKGTAWAAMVVLALPFLFTGCISVAKGPPFQAAKIPDGQGLIYIYQMKNAGPIAITTAVEVDGKPVVVMKNSGYYPHFAHPGKCVLASVQHKPSSVEIDVQPGQTYYVRCKYSWSFGTKPPMHLQVVPESCGKTDVALCKLLSD